MPLETHAGGSGVMWCVEVLCCRGVVAGTNARGGVL
jgi:hypothetical protein